MQLKLHNVLPITEVNGPGKRFGIWFQGCTRNCPNCFNKATHSYDEGYETDTNDLLREVAAQKGIEGVSISGGEPLEQAEALLVLVKQIKETTGLSVVLFTGYTLKEIQENPRFRELLFYIDILLAGPYIDKLKTGEPLLSSSNQKIHFLSGRYDFDDLGTGNLELIIEKDGTITLTGCSVITIE